MPHPLQRALARAHLLDGITSQSPGPELRLLLRAAVLDAGPAVAAWERCRDVDLARLGAPAQRLLPQLYRNLRAAGVRDRRVDALRDTHRKTWSRNRVRFRQLATLVERFAAMGIEVLLLKGAALIPLAYRDHGARPMTDFDVLIRPEHARHAMRLLGEWGWTATLPPSPALVDYRHADEFVHPSGQRLDLHWNALHECCQPGADDGFWDAAEPVALEGLRARTLCAADLLLHVCLHGARWSPVQPAAWLADAAMLLRSRGDLVDWTRFTAQAKERRLVAPVRGALRCLADCLDLAPPASVKSSLDAVATSLGERVEHAVKIRRRLLVGSLPVLWFDYSRLARGRAPTSSDLTFANYLRCIYRVPANARLPVEIVRLGTRRLGRMLSRDAGERRAGATGAATSAPAGGGSPVVTPGARE